MQTERTPRRSQRGSALISALVVFVALLGLLYASVAVSTVEVRDSRRSFEEVRAAQAANAGLERGLNFLSQTAGASGTQNPLLALTDLFAASATITPIVGEGLTSGGARVAAYTVSLTSLEQDASSVTVLVRATGYLPDAPANLPAGQQVRQWKAYEATVRYSLEPSEVFNYGYFINNWGWFYGDTIICRGNARSNGQFDAANYKPTATGQPLYESVAKNGGSVALSGYQNDNGDALEDGNDGGIFAGWDIVRASNIRGNGGLASNQHDYQDMIEMPNLSSLASYEANAKELGGTIKIDGTTVSNAVYGDEAGEKQNLYLIGTSSHPINLNGPVVVRGDVIISGYVTGQGAIYAGGNVYVPDSVIYKDPPTTRRPLNNTQASTEAWLKDNWSKDFLGLFARENIVVGDHTNSTWRSYVSSWMGSSLNQSKEDAGEDLIPNTRRGRDGVLGTADDDVLEGDGVFTIQHYTQSDSDLGLIPSGKQVGDPIPGTGEDIDGDGVCDGATTLANVTLNTAINSTNFGGNVPAGGVASFSSIASVYAAQLDAVFYTNHSFCWLVLGGASAVINGALISRNENIIYGTPTLETNYDCRLLGGASGLAANLLPRVLRAPEILRWAPLDQDPNRGAVQP